VKGEGYGTVVAVVQGVKSNQIGFNTGNSLLLKNLRIEGSIPGLYKGDSYDLSKLVLKGTDQYGNPVNISGQYVAWTITSGNNLGFITGNILKAEVEGTGTITANILGIISNKIYFTIKSRPYLKSITLSNTIPVLYVGDHYDLTKLTLVGKDQYGNAFNIAGQPLTWNILSGGSYFNISNNILTANSAGSGVIRVTVNGINSNQISISILNPQGTQRILSRLVISGVIPTLYTGNNYDLSRLTLVLLVIFLLLIMLVQVQW
jgi:surface antigen